MTNVYAIRSPIYFTNESFGTLFLRDAPSDERKKSIDFHIESGDYFGTLATTLGLVADTMREPDDVAKARLEDLRDELAFAQEHFVIERKGS